MKNSQNDYFKMLDMVSAILEKYAATWAGNAVCASLKADLDAATAGMGASLVAQQRAIITETKIAARKALELAMLPIARGLKAYAIVTNDEALMEEAGLNQWKLGRLTELELVGAARHITILAEPLLTVLEPYGIDAAGVADVMTKTTTFSTQIGKPAAARRRKAESTAALEAYRQSGVTACRKLDYLVPMFASASPEFVFDYQYARRLQRQGHRKRALQVRVTNSAGKPVAKAALTIAGQKAKRKTTAKGQAYVQHLPAGSHMLRIAAEGYAVKEVQFTVADRQRTIVEVVLAP